MKEYKNVPICEANICFSNDVCNGYHAESMMAYELKNIGILNAKGVD